MAVVNETGISGPLYANGVTTVFPFDCVVASAEELTVEVDGVPVDPDDYVVTLSEDFTGSITISPALAAGEIYIYSIPNFKQEVVFQRFGPFYPDQTNAPFDRAAIRDIYLKDRIERFSDALELEGINPSTLRTELASTAPNKGAALVGVRGFGDAPSDTQSEITNLIAKTVSVRDHGATQDDGTTAQQAFFSAAAQAAPAQITSTPAFSAMPQAPTGEVWVPDGLYHLTDDVDSDGKNIIWRCDEGARFTVGSASFLLGKVVRRGRTSNGFLFGALDHACGSSTMVGNGSFDNSPLISGITTPDQVSIPPTLDAAGRYVDITGVPLVHQSVATFTATTATLSVAAPVAKLRVGMFIQTTHAAWFRGVLTAWSNDGLTLTVSGWYPEGSTVAGTPANDGSQVLVNVAHKVWADNVNLFLTTPGYTYQGTVQELGVINQKVEATNSEDPLGRIWVSDAVNLGSYKFCMGYIARGPGYEGFRATGVDTGFVSAAFPGLGYAVPTVGFLHKSEVTVAFRQTNSGGAVQFEVQAGQVRAQKIAVSALVDAVDDTAAAAGGVTVGEFYRTGNDVKVRVA